MTGLHSPWGNIWSIASATGWTLEYILWGTSWMNIEMMIADSPRYVHGEQEKRGAPIETTSELIGFMGG